MVAVGDLALYRLPFDDPGFGTDPLPHFARARDAHGWLAASPLGFVVTDYAAIDEILRMDSRLKVPGEEIAAFMGAHGTGWGDFAQRMLLARSGPDHARLRGSVSAAFGPNSVKRMRPVMRETVAALLDEWVPLGAFDFARFAANFPVRIMFALIGASVDRLPEIIDSLEVQGSSFNMNVADMPAIEAAYQVSWRWVDALIAERGTAGAKGDLLDALIAASRDGRMDAVELRQMLIFLFAAGYDTSKNVLTLLMHSMTSRPAIWARCAGDRDYARRVVKEQLRHASPSNIYRSVVEPFDYRGVRLARGTMLIFPLGIAGQDPLAFRDGGRFDPDRQGEPPTLAFGRGMHICLGQFLAQAVVEEGAHLIAQRITKPRLAGEVEWRSFAGVWGIRSLPIAFDPAPAREGEAALAA